MSSHLQLLLFPLLGLPQPWGLLQSQPCPAPPLGGKGDTATGTGIAFRGFERQEMEKEGETLQGVVDNVPWELFPLGSPVDKESWGGSLWITKIGDSCG